MLIANYTPPRITSKMEKKWMHLEVTYSTDKVDRSRYSGTLYFRCSLGDENLMHPRICSQTELCKAYDNSDGKLTVAAETFTL